MAMTAEESERFYSRGRDIITDLAKAEDEGIQWADTFQARGGAAEMESHGPQTEQIVQLFRDLATFLNQNGRRQLIDKYRIDF